MVNKSRSFLDFLTNLHKRNHVFPDWQKLDGFYLLGVLAVAELF